MRTAIAIVGTLFALAPCAGDCRLPVARALRDSDRWTATAGRGPSLPAPQVAEGLTVMLHAGSGARVTFRTQNGRTMSGVPSLTMNMPRLVLHRNGALTEPTERTLIVEVSGIQVPPEGVTVTLAILTQHPDPDQRSDAAGTIPVVRKSQRIAGERVISSAGSTATFSVVFTETAMSGDAQIATPSDYFRVEVTVVFGEPRPNPTQALGLDHAFLMENQRVVVLPEVAEELPGAAPHELIVHICDMFPFQSDTGDPSTRLVRRDVPHFVEHELVPRIVEAYRLQTDLWGSPWPAAWTSLRPEDGVERLSVALSDGQDWYHGRSPLSGSASMSLNVSGYRVHADTLTDGLMSTFHHELFHNLQRAIHQNYGGDGNLGWHPDVWQVFSEGTAVLAASVALPAAHFTPDHGAGRYMSHANLFLTRNSHGQETMTPFFAADSAIPDATNYETVAPRAGIGLSLSDPRGYETMPPYAAAMLWRFLYEQCGAMRDGIEDPTAGTQVIRRALSALYSGEIVDVTTSTDLVTNLPAIMDRALAGSACPFQTFEDALVHLARAIYALTLDGGGCAAPGLPAGCALYDPRGLYLEPPIGIVTYTGVDQQNPVAIRSSFGMAFVDVLLDPVVDRQSLTIEFSGAPDSDAEFRVQLWKLIDQGAGARPRRIPAQLAAPEVLASADADHSLVYTIPAIDVTEFNRLGLIITRVDAQESAGPLGEFTIRMRPGTDAAG